MFSKNFTIFILLFGNLSIVFGLPKSDKKQPTLKDDKYRPQIHFSIAQNWINDPNGMVYVDGEYHLHYQYHPDGTTWGPMHWGHSVSTDLVKWTDLPIALYPDDLGQIFSGSAVSDKSNSTGFQTGDKTPIVAIFTHAGSSQQQSLAFSNDNGRTYQKFDGNPVIPNPGIADFRDPKVTKFGDSWILVLAAGNKVMFYKSDNLKSWELLSEFGADPSQGAHTGVWECPDLFSYQIDDQTVWVLIVSINPGGPNGGSVTQYFLGDFDGTTFSSSQTEPLWMDWGVDNYASVSFFDDPKGRIIMMGWMNNWNYANELPTNGWRGQMTLPRQLGLTWVQDSLRLASSFPSELEKLYNQDQILVFTNSHEILPDTNYVLTDQVEWTNSLLYLDLNFDISQIGGSASIAICFMNGLGQEVCTGYDSGRERNIFLDRERSGLTNFNQGFSSRPTAIRETTDDSHIRFKIYLDVSAIEVFVDSGLTCMTALFYPDEAYTKVEIRHHSGGNPESKLILMSAQMQGLKSMAEVK